MRLGQQRAAGWKTGGKFSLWGRGCIQFGGFFEQDLGLLETP